MRTGLAAYAWHVAGIATVADLVPIDAADVKAAGPRAGLAALVSVSE